MLFCIIGVFVVTASDTAHTYHVAIVGFLAAGLVMTTSSVNTLVYSSKGSEEAAAAGHILLSMVNVSFINSCLHCSPSTDMVTDCVDLLFWLDAFSSLPCLPRLVRTPQEPQTVWHRSRPINPLQPAPRYLGISPDSSAVLCCQQHL